ncbi:MAG: hypothetical protein GYA36_18910 [Veillonellaceae bacterium]|nr:hypothetical protein [Veillonellaceae bacterium]
MNTIIKTVEISRLRPHPYLEEVYDLNPDESLKASFLRTGNKPVYPPAVVPHPDPDLYWEISGRRRVETMIQMGQTEIEVILYETTDETEIKNLIIDLQNHGDRNGHGKHMEFRHFERMYPASPGIPGSRYSKIGKEIGRSKDWVKDMVILNNFFEGEGDCIIEGIFGNELSVSDGFKIKKVVEKYPEKFTSEKSFEKICDRRFDYNRLEFVISNLSIDDETEYDLLKSYLLRDITPQEFHRNLVQLGKIQQRIDNHEKNKVSISDLSEVYITENTCLIHGNNREAEFKHPFKKEIQCLVGSPPYGNRRLNGDNPDSDTGHGMTGKEYGQYLSKTYEQFKPFMSKDGSIYVIIDDYRMDNGALACSLEHFVVEMENKGFFPVGRYAWVKDNPMPRSYADKDMVNGFEMVYRFSLDPKNYYCNPDLFIELEKGKHEGFRDGCTNTDGKGKTSRGNSYYQSHLKKLRNALDERVCTDIIRGNVCNPQDFFRQADEKKHTSQSPLYLTSILILESTRPEDLVVDIWNGVGNTMDSALLLGRKYVGLELQNDYFQQSCRRAENTERIIRLNNNEDLSKAA